MVKKLQFSTHVVDKRLQKCKIILSRIQDATLQNLVFSDEKKFDVDRCNTQNDRVWSRTGGERSRVVARKQCPALVMVWAAVTESGRSPLLFVDQGVKLSQQNYRDDILLGALLPWARKHFKNVPCLFSRALHHHMGPKRLMSAFQRMFCTS